MASPAMAATTAFRSVGGGTREEAGVDSTFFKSLDLQVTFPFGSHQAPLVSGELTIVNPDGQTATVEF